MNKIYVVGLGPGHRDYIMPRALKVIEDSDVIIGGKRNIESLDVEDKKILCITADLKTIVQYIEENYKKEKMAIIVSGDTGYYSFLNYLKKHFQKDLLEVIPGLSSMQYMFAAIGESWHDAYVGSLHGREDNFIEEVKQHKKVGLLTDKKWTPQKIARELLKKEISNKIIYVGENLSYENERIVKGKPEEILEKDAFNMCVVVIMDED